MKPFTLHLGDCIEVMRGLPDNSVDSIVTDPPYGLSFMAKRWDYDVPAVEVWAECLRVLKPGGHLLAFSGSRTYHRMTCAIEDAGFEIRDQIMWVYGSGFPKSLNVSKAIDGHVTSGRSDSVALKEVNETRPGEATVRPTSTNGHRGIVGSADAGQSVKRDTPATPQGEQWDGWGTALKPAHEPICVARKPLVGTVAANVLEFGTGALNIDGCRVTGGDKPVPFGNPTMAEGWRLNKRETDWQPNDTGRWPANLIHDGSEEVVALFPQAAGQQAAVRGSEPSAKTVNAYGEFAGRSPCDQRSDTGSAARFFYCAKASRSDRNAGTDALPQKVGGMVSNTSGQHITRRDDGYEAKPQGNTHPTVKPTDLMSYLVRLVTPPGGVVLDPFMGSGSTGKAAMREGMQFIGVELELEYLAIATARIEHEHQLMVAANTPVPASPQMSLFEGAA